MFYGLQISKIISKTVMTAVKNNEIPASTLIVIDKPSDRLFSKIKVTLIEHSNNVNIEIKINIFLLMLSIVVVFLG